MVRGGMIGNELIGPFPVPEELKLSADTYCWYLLLPQLKKIIFMYDHLYIRDFHQ